MQDVRSLTQECPKLSNFGHSCIREASSWFLAEVSMIREASARFSDELFLVNVVNNPSADLLSAILSTAFYLNLRGADVLVK